LDCLDCDLFRQLVAREHVDTRVYERKMDAMYATDLLLEIESLGDRVITFRKQGRLSPEKSNQLLTDLLSYYADPLSHTKDVVEISRDLRRYDS
jgi:hypothetical protein